MPKPPLACASAISVLVVLVPSLHAQRAPEELVLALGLIDRGLHAEAVPKLERFLERNPRHARAPEAWYRLGVCHAECDAARQAVVALRKALRTRSFELRPEAGYRLATILQELGEHRDAEAEFGRLLEGIEAEHYLCAAAQFGRGECWRDLGDDGKAVEAFIEAADTGARSEGDGARYAFFGGYEAGFALLRLERFGAAQRILAELAKRHPDRPEIGELRYFEGDAAYRNKDLEGAQRAWQASAQHGGDRAGEALYGLAWCRVDSGDSEGGLELFQRVVKRYGASPVAAKAKLEAGRLLHETGAHRRAARMLEPLLEHPELGGRALEVRAAALLASGDTDAARASYQKVANAVGAGDPRAARLQYGLGESLAQAGRWREAVAAYEQAAECSDQELRGDAIYAQVVALHELGDYAESARRAAQFVRAMPKHKLAGEAAFARAENLFALERYVAALKSYDELPFDHPRSAVVRYKAAWASFLGGDARNGAARFERCCGDEALDGEMREEALSLVSLAYHEAGDGDAALQAADRYKARFPRGRFLGRTERIAGRVLRARGELEAATKRLAAAAQAEPDRSAAAELDLEQADVLFEQGDFQGARERYERAASRDDRPGARALEGLAWCAFELGDDRAALRAIAKCGAHSGADDAIRAGVAELEVSIHHRGEDWGKAMDAAARFLAKFSAHDRARAVRYALGVAQSRGGKAELARATLSRLAQEDPSGRVYYELAWACKKCGDEAGARQAFEQVVARSEDPDQVGEALLEVAADAKSADRMRELLGKVEGKHRGRALYRLGFALAEEERFGEAATTFEQLAGRGKLEPLYHEALFMAGEAALRAAEPKRALVHLDSLLREAPRHERAARARLYAGECAVRAGQPARAISALDSFLAAADDDTPKTERARAQLWLGRAHQDRKDHARAEAALAAATSLSDGEIAAEAQFRIGAVRYARGDREAAIEAWLKLSILFAHEPWVPRGLARAVRCYEELEQPDKAKRFRAELAERFPNSKEARRASR